MWDLISRPEVYARLHEKFVRSYVIEGLLEKTVEPEDTQRARDKAQNFLGDIARAGEQKFQSAGYGWDFRLRADGLAGDSGTWPKALSIVVSIGSSVVTTASPR